MGVIDAKMLDESLRAMSTTGQRKLHGLVLLEKNALDTSQLDQGLRVQLLRKVAQLARMPPAAVFEFYTDWDGLTTFGAEPTPIDALSVVWAAIREAPPLDHVKAALERLMQGPRLRITKQAQLDRFGFTSEERRWIDLLRMKPLRLDAFFSSAEINERIARLIVYCLAITKQVELVGEDAEPSSGNIAAAEPSSSAPQSPRSTVGRVTLRRERVRTQPVIEEKSSPDILDRRMSPSPDAAANPEVRRAEINMRAQGVDKQNYFEMLGISPEATTEDVKNAYIALAKTWHPDRLPSALADVKDACARVFARMSEAHQTLTDDEKRRRYLRLMKEGGETPEQQQEIANVLGATVEFQKAEICLRKNDLAQAELMARHAVELDPNQADYVALVAWLEALKPSAQTPEATQAGIDDLDRALKMNERCERAYFYRAMLYKRQHRNGLAFKDFQKVAELNPKNIDAQRELRLYEMRGGPPKRITPYPSQPPASKPGLFQKFFKK